MTKEAFYPFPNFSRNHVELCCSIFFYLLSQHKALHCFCLLFLIHSPNGVHSEFRVEFLSSSSSIQEDSIQSRSFSQVKLIDIHTVVVEAAYQFSIRSFSSKTFFVLTLWRPRHITHHYMFREPILEEIVRDCPTFVMSRFAFHLFGLLSPFTFFIIKVKKSQIFYFNSHFVKASNLTV